MLEVLYNDIHNELSFIHNVNKETLLIVDSDLEVYEAISYNPFEPSDSDLLNAWQRATHKYYHIDNDDEWLKDYRVSQKEQSDEAFKKYLEEEHGNNGI